MCKVQFKKPTFDFLHLFQNSPKTLGKQGKLGYERSSGAEAGPPTSKWGMFFLMPLTLHIVNFQIKSHWARGVS